VEEPEGEKAAASEPISPATRLEAGSHPQAAAGAEAATRETRRRPRDYEAIENSRIGTTILSITGFTIDR
jgi:hypothetical protein